MTIAMERDYRLLWMHFDRYGRMQPAAMLEIFQDLAIAHAEELGIGRSAMLEKNVVWVVIRTKLEVLREPKYNTIVTARTWPHSLSKFSFIRDFTIRDEQGELLVKATQEWVLEQLSRFSSAKDAYHGSHDFDEARAFEQKPRKISDFEIEGEPAFVVTPAYTDIDVNGHVNNAVYPNFVMNALNPGPEGSLRTFQIDYRHEVLPDVPLSLYVHREGESVRVKAINPEGTVLFASALEYQK